MPAEIACFASPGAIYRYRSLGSVEAIEQELSAIREAYIFCSSYKNLNDPMEGRYRMSALFAESSRKQEVLDFIDSHGVASFSETHENETMWAYYASRFQGICVKYSVKKLLAGLPSQSVLAKMNYNERPPMLLRDRENSSRKAKMALSYKTIRWAHEREWRLITENVGRAYYQDTGAVSAIYVGARISPAVRDMIISTAAVLNIKCCDMNVDSYSLDFEDAEAPEAPKAGPNRRRLVKRSIKV